MCLAFIFLTSVGLAEASLGISDPCGVSSLGDVKRNRAEVDRLFKEEIPKLLIPFPLQSDGGRTVRKREKGGGV